jgi:predicted amidophosphoribosyltransferase
MDDQRWWLSDQDRLVCPNCHAHNRLHALACDNCGDRLAGAQREAFRPAHRSRLPV